MSKCIVYGCGRPTSTLLGCLCDDCFGYLHSGEGDHPTLMRPKWELVPRLQAIAEGLKSEQALIRTTSLKSLDHTIELLNRKHPQPKET
jgi:hypothetical protein